MSQNTPTQTKSAKLKKALAWMAETLEAHPGKRRITILQEAELRFDLTPAECEFIDKHFGTP
jgi:hypothetical protein